MTHWPRRQVKFKSVFTAYRIQYNANSILIIGSTPRSSKNHLFFCIIFIWNRHLPKRMIKPFLGSGLAVWRDWEGKSAYRMIRRLRMKPTDVEKLSEPFCPEPHVRPPPHFHVNFTLTSFSPSKTHILPPSLRTVVDGMRPMPNILVVYAPNDGHLKLSMRTES